MSRKSRDLDRISRLVDADYVARQSRLARLKGVEQELRARLAGLTDRRGEEERLSLDPATRAGADLRWQKWANERRSEINLHLAHNLAEQEMARRDLGRAFGRNQAVDGLKSEAKAERLKQLERLARQRD